MAHARLQKVQEKRLANEQEKYSKELELHAQRRAAREVELERAFSARGVSSQGKHWGWYIDHYRYGTIEQIVDEVVQERVREREARRDAETARLAERHRSRD